MRNAFIVVSSVVGTWLVLGIIAMLRTPSKATGLPVIWLGAIESLFSPVFWILSVGLFIMLFTAARATRAPLRVIFY